MATPGPRIAVVGAGAVGMSTAVRLQIAIPGCHVTVMAASFSPFTTSDGAAGIFRPTRNKTPGVPMDTLRAWLQDSWNYLSTLATSSEASDAGVTYISGYQLEDGPVERPLFSEFVHSFRELAPDELNIYPGNHKFGFSWTTLLCESRRYLPYLTRQFLSRGGAITQRHLQSLSDIEDTFDVIVNCAGFGNTSLINDNHLVPIKGHLIRVEAPWVKHFIYAVFGECYIIPGRDCIIVGGTNQKGNADLTIQQEDHDAIWRRACRVMPSLKKGRKLEDWVGLRPHREPLRIEADTFKHRSGKVIKVVHNYGHGAEGVSLSWGTAGDAVKIVQQLLKTYRPNVTSRL